MRIMKLCNKCGKLMGYNSYFGGYYCTSCGRLEIEKKQVHIDRIKSKNIKRLSSKIAALPKGL